MLNPLAPVIDYQSMLNRIFWFTTASALGAIWLLRAQVAAVDAALSQIDFAVGWQGQQLVPAPGGSLLPALAIGMAARIFRLHARIADFLGLREIFDIEVIIQSLADKLDVSLEPLGEEPLRQARHALMRKAFYPYVGGPQQAVDDVLVQQALDAWSWLWVAVEAIPVWTCASFCLLAAGATRVGFETLGAAMLVALLGLPALRSQCKRYAIAQVRAIVADPARAAAVRRAFDEVLAQPPVIRLAA
ncbi:MAG TPA: hypothetical protein VEQ85_08730 [Lacipirellulaceae bacterium]|nr:hypothetical protein [Lacipirellulaceae bacterium]